MHASRLTKTNRLLHISVFLSLLDRKGSQTADVNDICAASQQKRKQCACIPVIVDVTNNVGSCIQSGMNARR